MSVGVSTYDLSPGDLVELAVVCEQLGFESIWLGEHVVLPQGYASAHPTSGHSEKEPLDGRPIVDPHTRLVDPWVGLGAVAGRTSSLQLGTAVFLAPLRHPLLTARAVATLHDLSAGRFLFGMGVGWLREEFDALGVPFARRGRLMEEILSILRLAWNGGPVSHEGEHFAFDSVQVCEQAIEVPVILGGNSDRAMHRAATLADGWMSSGIPTFEEAVALETHMSAVRAEVGHAGPFRTYYRVPGADPAAPDRYREAGIENVVLFTGEVIPNRGTASVHDALAAYANAASLTTAER